MKKIVSLLLALGLTAGLLAGCGGGDSGSTDANNNASSGNESRGAGDNGAESDDVNAVADGDTYHMVMEFITYGFDDPDIGMVQDAVNEITVPEIGVEVEFKTVPIAEMATKLGLMVSGGEQIDMVVTGLLTTPANLASEGLIQPITQYVEGSEVLSSLSEGIIDACKVNGEIYCYPGSLANGVQVTYFYDADLAAQYNIQMPERIETAENWKALFEQIKASGMEQYGISLGDGQAAEYEWADMDSLGDEAFCSYGVVMDSMDGNTVVNWYATEEYMNKCKMHREWYEKGYCVPDSSSNGYSTTDSMTQGMIFGFVSNGGAAMSDAYFSKVTGKNIASVPMSDILTKAGNVVNFSWGVSSSCQQPQKVIDFLELVYTNTELANLMNYGIEGTHYVTNEGSQIISYPEGVDATTCGYGNFIGTYGDVTKTYQREPLTDEFIAEVGKYMYPDAPSGKLMGYTFDPTSVSTELTAVTAVIGQYGPALECGTVDPEQMVPEFLNALEAAGMNKIIEANQEQLDTWLAGQ